MFAEGDRGLKTGDLVVLLHGFYWDAHGSVGPYGSNHFCLKMYVSSCQIKTATVTWEKTKYQSSVAKVSFVSIFANFSDLHSKILHMFF